ncbi:leucine-rich repeat-containing protein 36 isoform X1 [Monodelphis domestica]|uniref:Leucine rich repeat containing 36 n=2 Tax=Monodelphis domestica TaxID=13616 RepID=F6WF28_MONDO|nr:leucine-rich repeat-containing protein 36 isoform X1 [Monodelphis domestica]
MAEQWDLNEEGLRRMGALTQEEPELVESLSLQGSYVGKIHSIGETFKNFKNLRSLDLSRNLISSLQGIEYLSSLQDLNLYYNNIPSLAEVSRLQALPCLKMLDLRLNPVVRKDSDYRLFAVHMLQNLEKLDDRSVRESERKAAKLNFSQLGSNENFLFDVENKREKTLKNCVMDERSSSKLETDVDNRIETELSKGLFLPLPNREIKDSLTSASIQTSNPADQKLDTFPLGTQLQEVARRELPGDVHEEDEFRCYPSLQSSVRSPDKMAKEGFRLTFSDGKSLGSSPEKELISKADAYQLSHEVLSSKRLDVGDSSQIHPYQLPKDNSLDNYNSHYPHPITLHGSFSKKSPTHQRSKNYRDYSTKSLNDTKSISCGDIMTPLTDSDSATGRLLKLSSDLYTTGYFSSDPALLSNIEQQLSGGLTDLTQVHGSFKNNTAMGNSLRTLLLPSGTQEDRGLSTKRSVSPTRRAFKRKDGLLSNVVPKHGFQDVTNNELLSSDPGSLLGLQGNHSPPPTARTSHVVGVLQQLLELVDKHWNGSGSLLLNKKFLVSARDMLLSLVVPNPAQQWTRSLPEESLKSSRRRDLDLKDAGQFPGIPNDLEALKQKMVRVLEENLFLSEKVQLLEENASNSGVGGHQSHSYDELLRKNQQLNLQVNCLNQELNQLKKLEETVCLLQESQRSLVTTNEYLLQQLNKEQKGYMGKAILPPEKSHRIGRTSPFGKPLQSSLSQAAPDCESSQRERLSEGLETYMLR